jgi:hypothetical protein
MIETNAFMAHSQILMIFSIIFHIANVPTAARWCLRQGVSAQAKSGRICGFGKCVSSLLHANSISEQNHRQKGHGGQQHRKQKRERTQLKPLNHGSPTHTLT